MMKQVAVLGDAHMTRNRGQLPAYRHQGTEALGPTGPKNLNPANNDVNLEAGEL